MGNTPDVEANDALNVTRRYSPIDPDEQRRAFVLILAIDTETGGTAEQILAKCRLLEPWLKTGKGVPERPGLKMV